mmetsp:Transcript_38182/g.121313  ORF Transcript_38182/g.121313 Transcript_38182/m.121313 type:complete len:227 (+) Transcript_38182:102-782(+)
MAVSKCVLLVAAMVCGADGLAASRGSQPDSSVNLALSRDDMEAEVRCKGQLSDALTVRGKPLGQMCTRLGKNANLLVIGSRTPAFWVDSNVGGRTELLQHLQEAPKSSPSAAADEHLKNEAVLREVYEEQISTPLTQVKWDQILVDSMPGAGSDPESPTRSQSIFSAHLLAKGKTEIFVADCERAVDLEFVKHWLVRDGRQLTKMVDANGKTVCHVGPSIKKRLVH